MIESFNSVTTLCVGDIILDQFNYGYVERISPEAPVPVLHKHRSFSVLGGVGNVARNIISLGGSCILGSVMGCDNPATKIKMLCEDLFPHLEVNLVQDPICITPFKERFIADGQQLLRVDEENITNLSKDAETELVKFIERKIHSCHSLVLSDYAKGTLTKSFCQQVIQLAKSANIPVIVDPKGTDLDKYIGATIVTPNLKELNHLVGRECHSDAEVIEAAKKILCEVQSEYLLVTRGKDGMTLVGKDGTVAHDHAKAKEIYDVSGAGDTVVATLALAIGSEAPLTQAMHIANMAAGIAVGKIGTAVVTQAELQSAEVEEAHAWAQSKIFDLDHLQERVKKWRRHGLKVGFTNGCFDLLHAGHLHILRSSKRECDKLIVAINTDSSVQGLKGPTRPIQNENLRAEIIASLQFVDAVILFSDETPLRLITALLPDILVKGQDYTIDRIIGADVVQANGGKVVLVDLKPGFSTTSTIAKMNSVAA